MRLQQAIERRWYASSPGILSLLLPLEYVFKALSRRRKGKYLTQLGKSSPEQASFSHLPVIVIGNLSVGGTGKTPVIIALTRLLQSQGLKVGVVSRGYGRKTTDLHHLSESSTPTEAGDEPLEIMQRCYCDVVVAKERVLAVEYLVKHCKPDVILSDDGLQHYAMARQMEIVVANVNQGFGNGHCLPVGPLREPINRLQDVDFLLINGNEREHPSLKGLPHMKRSAFTVAPAAWVNVVNGEREALDFQPDQPTQAYAGIGQPEKFFSTLRSLGIEAECSAKLDHAKFEQSDFNDTSVKTFVMTAKDAVKCKAIAPNNAWYLEVNAELNSEFEAAFLERVKTQLSQEQLDNLK